VEELTRHLALTLVDAGDQVEIWTQQHESMRPEVQVLDGLTVRRFDFPLPRADARAVLRAGTGGARTLIALRAAVRSFRPDVLHVQCFGPNGLYATALSAWSRVPLVISLQGETVMDDQNVFEVSSTLRAALRVGLKRAGEVTACSRFTLEDARSRFGLGATQGRVVFNGVSLTEQNQSFAPPTSRYVLGLGRLEDKKGFDLLIRAFADLADAHPDVELRIAGAGTAEAALAGLIDAAGRGDRIRLIGRLGRDQVSEAMAGAEVFVMPSRVEPFGIVILEAWRAGTPPVVTCHGGPPEFVDHGATGVVVDPTDTGALTGAMDGLLRDEGLRRAIGDAGQRRVADFDWKTIAGQYRDCYARLAAVARKGP